MEFSFRNLKGQFNIHVPSLAWNLIFFIEHCFNYMYDNAISMRDNECMKMKILPKLYMGKNSMHEVVFSPTTHENCWGEKIPSHWQLSHILGRYSTYMVGISVMGWIWNFVEFLCQMWLIRD